MLILQKVLRTPFPKNTSEGLLLPFESTFQENHRINCIYVQKIIFTV